MIDIQYRLFFGNQPRSSYSFNDLVVQSPRGKSVDRIGLIQFVLFLHPLFSRTFIEDIKCVYNGSERYSLRYNEDRSGYDKNKEAALWEILVENIREIARQEGKVYGVGNSGGLDSRIVLYVLSKLSRSVEPYTFGSNPSDALYIAGNVAKKLCLKNTAIDIEHDFLMKYYAESIDYNPMYSLLYSWYLAARNYLPAFDIHITGFNGDNMLGSHLRDDLRCILKREDLYSYIYNYYRVVSDAEVANCLIDRKLLVDSYEDYRNNINKTENVRNENIFDEFDFTNRQLRFIINSNNFHYCRRMPWYSPYYNQRFMRFAVGLTFEERFKRKLVFRTVNARMRELSLVRFERTPYSSQDHCARVLYGLKTRLAEAFPTAFNKGNHKNVIQWLEESNAFNFIKSKFLIKNDVFSETFDLHYINANLEDIYRKNKFLVFNLLTVKLWMDRYLSH